MHALQNARVADSDSSIRSSRANSVNCGGLKTKIERIPLHPISVSPEPQMSIKLSADGASLIARCGGLPAGFQLLTNNAEPVTIISTGIKLARSKRGRSLGNSGSVVAKSCQSVASSRSPTAAAIRVGMAANALKTNRRVPPL